MAQADSTKANKLAYLHMRIVRRVLRCLLNEIVTRDNPQRTLDEYIEQNDDRILESELARRHRHILFPRGRVVTMDILPLYLIEFLMTHVSDCSVVPRDIKDVLHELNQKRKELYTEIVMGVDDTFFTEHLENVTQLLARLCQFMGNSQLTIEMQEEIANICPSNVDQADEVFDEFKHQQEEEKYHRKAITSFPQEYLRLHRMQEKDVSIREADEPGLASDEKALPPRPEDKYPIQVPEAVIEIAVQSRNDTGNVRVARDIVNVINSRDEDVESAALKEKANEIRATLQNTFSYYGEYYARQGCIQIWVKPRTIKHVFKLFEDCVSGKLTQKLKPIEELIRGIPNFENYKQEAVLYQDHYDSVLNDITSQMCRILKARGLALPNEKTVPKVELSSNGTILVRVPCPSTQERDEYENAINAGRLNDLFRTLEDNLRNTYSVPDLALNAAVVKRTTVDTATVKQRDENVPATTGRVDFVSLLDVIVEGYARKDTPGGLETWVTKYFVSTAITYAVDLFWGNKI